MKPFYIINVLICLAFSSSYMIGKEIGAVQLAEAYNVSYEPFRELFIFHAVVFVSTFILLVVLALKEKS